jgi:thiol-disulfide isomerase/thioredoxin
MTLTYEEMRKPLILILAIVATLAGLAIGFTATRARKPGIMGARRNGHLLHMDSADLRKAAAREPDSGQDGDAPGVGEVIRFASNPEAAPAFLTTDVAGNPVSTAEWKGKVVILNFWATWCPPCRAEIPILVDLQNRYKGRLEVIGVSVDDAPPADVAKFAEEMGLNYPVVMANRALVREYGGVPALPTAFVINEETKVVQKHVGLFPESLYEQEVRALLNLPVDVRIETFKDEGEIFLGNAALATELPGVDFKGLSEDQKQAALRELNTKTCACGCNLTLAQCRIVDSPCLVSKRLANEAVKKILPGNAAPATAAPNEFQPEPGDKSSPAPDTTGKAPPGRE